MVILTEPAGPAQSQDAPSQVGITTPLEVAVKRLGTIGVRPGPPIEYVWRVSRRPTALRPPRRWRQGSSTSENGSPLRD